MLTGDVDTHLRFSLRGASPVLGILINHSLNAMQFRLAKAFSSAFDLLDPFTDALQCIRDTPDPTVSFRRVSSLKRHSPYFVTRVSGWIGIACVNWATAV